MSTAALNRDGVVDLQGVPLRADAVEFLTTLDRLLTVGTYYAVDHEQYLRAVEEACAHLVRAISPRLAMSVEIAAKGLLIEGQVVDPHQRLVRKVHDLLVPLNIARLELSRDLTPDDLRAALATLQAQRLKLGQSEGFHQIVITDLPPTVSIASRKIGTGGEPSLPAGLLGGRDETAASDAGTDAGTDGGAGTAAGTAPGLSALAHDLLSLAEQLLGVLAAADATPGGPGERNRARPVSLERLATLRGALQRLVEARPDPAQLLRLIRQAEAALELGGDPAKVDLAFRVICRELGTEATGDQELPAPALTENLAFTAGMLTRACEELAARNVPVAPPLPSARRDVLAVTLNLLAEAPSEPLRSRCLAALEAGLARGALGPEELAAVAANCAFAVHRGTDTADRVLPPVLTAIRRHHSGQLAALWERLRPADAAARLTLWPHLVNDLLLGLDPAPQSAVMTLWVEANAIDAGKAAEPAVEPAADLAAQLATRLGRLESLADEGAAARLGDLLLIPAARVANVLTVLMGSRLAGRVGPLLHQALQRGQGGDLARVLTSALGDYDPAHRRFYTDLAHELAAEAPSPRFARQAAGTLLQTLAELTPAERREAWTAEAIAWLPALAGVAARPLLDRIVDERRFVVLKAWPTACRAAAREARDRLRDAAPGAD